MRHACWPAPLLTSLLLVSGVTVGCATTKAGPTIDSLSPSSGPVGTSLTIKGNYFQATQGTSTVTFNGVQASATSWSAKKIVATAPGATTTGPVVVNVSGVPSNSDKIFTVSGLTPDFTLSVSPLSHTVVQCGPTGYTVTLASLNGFNSAVTLSVTSGLPAGATTTFSPNPAAPPGSSTLTVTTQATTPTGSVSLVIQGAGGGQTHSATVTLTLAASAPADVSLDTRVLATKGIATFDIIDASGAAVGSGRTDRVEDLTLNTGCYTLRAPAGGGAGAVTLDLTVNAACALSLP